MNHPYTTTKKSFNLDGKDYFYYSLPELARILKVNLSRLPFAIRILLESCLRNHLEADFAPEAIRALANWHISENKEYVAVPFLPARVLMQDFTGVPVLNDLTALRAAMQRQGKDPHTINPSIPSDLVIDHSLQVQAYGCEEARQINEEREFQQNFERYHFLKWSEKAYDNLCVLPPGLGICHQVNLEHLGRVAFVREDADNRTVYPDTVLGTDSHTTMINGLGVLGWGVGGIEALASMLRYPSEIPLPQVIGVRLVGKLPENSTPTDLTLTLTSRLREVSVVGKFVEVFGESTAELPVETRAMIANMTPESGATATYFPVDTKTLDYLRRTGREDTHIRLVETYFREQQLFQEKNTRDAVYSSILEFNLETVRAVLAGPKRPQDIFFLSNASQSFQASLTAPLGHTGFALEKKEADKKIKFSIQDEEFEIGHGVVLIAAITSCTNTSDPRVMVAAGLLARNAVARGLKSKPWVKTSFAPGSRAVHTYLEAADLLTPSEALGFHIVGYGCTTCIGNSGPLEEKIRQAVIENDIIATAVLSGNRNFEGRIHPHVRANYLASPPLVIAYALAGRMDFDFEKTSLGKSEDGLPVFLKDIYPSAQEIEKIAGDATCAEIYEENYSGLYQGNPRWNAMRVPASSIFPWNQRSTMLREPKFLLQDGARPRSTKDITHARVLAFLGDSITTDHISPAGRIAKDSPAGAYLQSEQVKPEDFITFGARRGNHEVMQRGTFSNPRLHNRLAEGKEGGFTTHFPSGELMSLYQAASRYQQEGIPLIILAGKAYGTGSSRDWAAKGTYLLGVRAVLAESFERIHRTNLVCMGVLPLQFDAGMSTEKLGLKGDERFSIHPIAAMQYPREKLSVYADRPDGERIRFQVTALIETPLEMAYFHAGGLARKVLADL